MMSIPSCRIVINRNLSTPSLNSSIPTISSSRPLNISDGEWIVNSISLIIFILAVLGNTAALFVMFGSRGPIKLTNNKYLVNLACADLLRACFMPFTIIARVKRNFIFGPMICKILPIIQGWSVAVDVFTLVCISVERYIAICHPLLILKLQSLRFVNVFNGLILFLIWALGFLTALPNITMYNLCSLPQYGRFKCEKVKSESIDERFYMVALDIFYFLAPMFIMVILYTRIICKIYKKNMATKMRTLQRGCSAKSQSSPSNCSMVRRSCSHKHQQKAFPRTKVSLQNQNRCHGASNCENSGVKSSFQGSIPSRSHLDDDEYQLASSWSININYHNRKCITLKSICSSQQSKQSKSSNDLNSFPINQQKSVRSSSNQGVDQIDRHRRKALKLLIVIIFEFFICWTPLFIYHTFGTFDKKFYRSMPTIFVDLILLFSFASLITNPFTYYFMSKRYRAVLYTYLLSCCCCNTYESNSSKKNQDARHIIEALRLHQQQNSQEYRQKTNKLKTSSPDYILCSDPSRPCTLH